MLLPLDQLVQHLVVDVLDLVRRQLAQEPAQHRFLLVQVAVVDARYLVLKVDQGREVVDPVLPRRLRVVNLDELDPLAVALVVDVLQLDEGRHRVFVLVVVWYDRKFSKKINK